MGIRQKLAYKWWSWRSKTRLWLRRTWYSWRYGIDTHKTLLPSLQKGKFISVFQKGPYTDIIAHKRLNSIPTGTIRLIPCQYNHGIMVEFWNDEGKMCGRTGCSYDQFYKIVQGIQEKP